MWNGSWRKRSRLPEPGFATLIHRKGDPGRDLRRTTPHKAMTRLEAGPDTIVRGPSASWRAIVRRCMDHDVADETDIGHGGGRLGGNPRVGHCHPRFQPEV